MMCRRKTVGFLVLGAAVLALGCPSGDGNVAPGAVPEEIIELNILGTAYLGQFSWEPAYETFSEAVERRSSDPLLLNNLGVTLVQQNRLDEAIEAFNEALAVDPDFPWAHYNLGLLAKNDGNFAGAVTHFETVAAYDPDDLHTQYNLASVLARLDRPEEAETAFRNALAMNPTHVSTLYALGQFLMQSGRQDEGIELIQASEEIRTRHGGDTIGIAYGEQGAYAMGVDYPGDALAAPAPIEVRFEAGATISEKTAAWTLAPADGGAELITVDGSDVYALATGDLDNDGSTDRAALSADFTAAAPSSSVRVQIGDRGWETLDLPWPDQPAGPESLALVDKDHDGDLDLVACGRGGCMIAVNDGSGSFTSDTVAAAGRATGRLAPPVQVTFSDLDNDRDIDLVIADAGGVRWFSNQRDGTFTAVGTDRGLDAGVGGGPLKIVDLDKNGTMDLLLAGPGGLRWLPNKRGRFGAPQTLAAEGVGRLVITDIDNDGFLDPVFSTPAGIAVLHNRGAGSWERRDELFAGAGAVAEPLESWDADGDGDLDLAVRGPDGTVTLWTNEGGNANRSITITAQGVGDNKFGIGSKVEILAGALRQKFERTRPVPLVVGLGGRETVQSVRMLWPSGVLQDEVNLPVSEVAAITQLDRKGTSCPLLYAWRDGAWRFVTDFLGGAAIGYQKAPGVFSIPDTDETILVGQDLTEDGGWLKLRLNNQLEEVIWFDQAELIVVDHPAGSSVYPNERLMPAPPFPEFRLYASDEIRPATVVRNDDFELLPYKGYAETHTLELDLGAFENDERVVLLLDGWIDYADSSANVAALQAGATLLPPRLSVADGDGNWTEAPGRMGFPAGLPKTMSVDLSGLFRSDDHRVRITTSMRIYWNRMRVMVGGEDLPLSAQRIPVAAADLRFGGFPRPTEGKPLAYDPEQVSAHGGWKAHVGAYTGFGDVAALLRDIDDAFVTTRNGDEIELRFAAPEPPAAGMERTYLLFTDGFGKDMDPNSAAANDIGPLPFHGMPYYPYGDEVSVPQRPLIDQPPPRHVRPSDDGWPGALPQVLASRTDAP